MSTRFSINDTDILPLVDGGDLTLTAAPGNNELIVEVGNSLWTTTEFRQRITRALEQMRDALREAQWPDGPLAATFATMAGVETPKGQIIIGNAAVAPAITEDGIRIAYNWPTPGLRYGGSGSSTNRGIVIDRVNDFIRELLATEAVAPP